MARAKANQLTSQVTLVVLVLAFAGLVSVVGFGLYGVERTDGDALAQQKTFVANGIKDHVEAVVRQQQSVTVWDDSIIAARSRDQSWLAENLGEWMHAYYGHDRIYLVDAADRPIYAMQNGKTVEPAAFDADRGAVEPTLERLQALIASQPDRETDEKPVASDLVSFDGHPAVLAIQPLTPSTEGFVLSPGEAYFHIDIKFIDQALIDQIGEKYLLSDARLLPGLTTPVTGAAVPLLNSKGVILGYLAWSQYRPGAAVARQIAPVAALVFLAAGAVVAFLLTRLRRESEALQSSRQKAEYLAFHDTLTGLPNRALFEDRLARALLSVSRRQRRVALLYLDLDRFKTINDTFGHPAGDDLVRQTARRLEQSVRNVDTVARLGGDEFAVIIVDLSDIGAAETLCERLLDEIGQPFDLMGNQVFVGASIGLAISSEAGSDPADLLRKADIALYEAKKNGRGRHQLFVGDMDDILARKRLIETDLRQALTYRREVRLAYQPIFSADRRNIVGAEALLRWDHPVHGDLPPAQFIALAEERGFIDLLGDFVLREALAFAATSTLPWIAVNVSALQLRDEGFAPHMLDLVRRAGIEPARLQIEMTETALIDDSPDTRHALAELRKAGIHVALDDFGTGYSSISYLRRHAIDKLKIDRSFVRHLGSSKRSTAIVKALIELARALDVRVTAEGVETAAQAELLAAMGCDEFQGFLLSAPVSAEMLRERLAATAPVSRRAAV